MRHSAAHRERGSLLRRSRYLRQIPPRKFLSYDWRIRVGRFAFLAADLAVVVTVEVAMIRSRGFRSHGEDVAVVLAFVAGGVIATVGIDHALGEISGMDELIQRERVVSVLLVERLFGADDDAHVCQSVKLRVRSRRVALVFWGIA